MRRIALSFGKGAPLLVGASLFVVGCSPMADCIEPRQFEVELTAELGVSFDGTTAMRECGMEEMLELTVQVSRGRDAEDTRDWTGTSCRIASAQVQGAGMSPAGRIHSDDIRGISGTYRELAVGRVAMSGGREYLVGLLCDSRETCTWEEPQEKDAQGAIIFVLAGSDPPCAQAFEVELL